MDTTRNEIYLAALLHDIGKFYQRADENGVAKSTLISREIKSLESSFCPSYKGIPSHKHVLWTAQFFIDFEQHLKNLFYHEKSVSVDKLMRLSAIHHNPAIQNIKEMIIQKADHYSSGADRSLIDDAWKDSEEEDDKKWDSFRRIKMRSVFEGISLNHKQEEPWTTDYKYKIPLTRLELSNNYFPAENDDTLPDYKTLWRDFTSEVKFIQTNSFKTFTETLLALLKKYASNIPSSTQHLPDVSLFDHLKTSAAFAVCLYDYLAENKFSTLPSRADKPFLLIGGDLSGIQKFIYGIIARGAAKNLKGRSFYLHLLVDNIVQALVDELELFDSNIIYSSGGGFYLLAPNNSSITEKLILFNRKIEKQLFDFHKTDLYFSFAAVPFGEEEIYFSNNSGKRTIGNVWEDLTRELSNNKEKRFKHLIETEYDTFFMPGESGGIREKDAITGEEIAGKSIKLDDHTLSSYTYSQIQLGERLRNSDYWLISREILPYFPKEALAFEPIKLGYFNYFIAKSFFDDPDNRNKLKKSADRIRAVAINEMNFLESPQKGIDNIYGFDFYGGNKYPESKWHSMPKVFEELAGVEFADDLRIKRKTSPALIRIGILRMDVDNLGVIFRRGLSIDKRSFSRYSVLSRSLDYFFKGYLNTIWNQEKYKELTQIIYAGGDDLFLIGKWEILIEMASEINTEFRKWTCHNPDLTLSGGLAFVYPKFPILKSSAMSEIEEKNGKNHEYGLVKKNSISMFSFPVNWDTEFIFLSKLKEEIKILLDQKGLYQGFSSDMFNLMESAKLSKPTESEDKFKLMNYQVIWHTAYNFKRAMQRNKNDHVKTFFAKWIELIYTGKIPEIPETKYHSIQFLALAARWASLELRNATKNN
jgi:CRISPR-associated protein Csm1